MKTVNKWFFKNFRADIRNLYFLKQIPFITFSDLSNPRYDIIEKILDKVNLDKKLLVSVGEKQAPFGMTVNPEGEQLNLLLNSATYSFVLTDRIEETDYLLKSVLAGIIPICSNKHVFIKRLGLKGFATNIDFPSILDKLCEIKYYQNISNRKIALLSWKYRNQLTKWKNV